MSYAHLRKSNLSDGRVAGITRRALVLRGAALTSMVSAAGCDLFSRSPASKNGAPKPAGHQAKEAPMLASRVRAGRLPSLSHRLPGSPQVVKPAERAGTYGGTMLSALTGPTESNFIQMYCQYDRLVAWKAGWTGASGTDEIYPDVAKEFNVNSDGTAFTFTLREGMKWSDGHPFTTDDILFAINDVLFNKDIFPATDDLVLSPDGKAATVESPDDHTFTIKFASTNALFLKNVASASSSGGDLLTHFPKHYLKQFHAKYSPRARDLAKKQGFDSWSQLFTDKSGPGGNWGANPDLPTLGAWRLVTPFGRGTQVVLERNPYYWKVDQQGRQLPYIDRVNFPVINDFESILLRAVHGDISFEAPVDPRITTAVNKPVLARNRDQGGYRFIDSSTERSNIMVIMLNMTIEDPAKRAMFRNKQFRIALSHAMNREEMIKTTLLDQGTPWQVAPLPASPFYDEEFAKQYLAYDPKKSKRILDQILPDTNSDGIRLGPDGKPVTITLIFTPAKIPVWADMLELVKEYWRAVGVDLELASMSKELYELRTSANKHDATVDHSDGGLAVFLSADYYMPRGQGFAQMWANWQEGAEPKERPPEPVRRSFKLYERIRTAASATEQAALMRQLLAIAKDEFYVIGTAHQTGAYFLAKNNLHNVPDHILEAYVYGTPGPTRPEQFYFTSES